MVGAASCWKQSQPPASICACPPPLYVHAIVCVQDMPEWSATMDGWGSKLLEAVTAVSKMAAVGFGLPADAFSSRMAGGPHLLAPTGSDLVKHGTVGTVLAGFHYDLNFITVSVSSPGGGEVWRVQGAGGSRPPTKRLRCERSHPPTGGGDMVNSGAVRLVLAAVDFRTSCPADPSNSQQLPVLSCI